MNNIIKKLAYICTGLAITTSAVAQAPHTSYFMESMPTRHQLNPALTPNYNYVNLPLIPLFSGIQIGLNSNVGMANFLYPRGNELVTGLHSSVSNDEFLGNIHRNNIIEANIKYNLVSFGFAKWGGYNTFDLSARSITNMNMPYELFEFAKVGQINGEATTYNIPDLAISTYNYAELTIGHSRKITERLTVGAKFKFLAGIVHASAEINELNISMSQDKWQIQEKGRIFTTPGIQINYKDNGEIDNIDTGTFGMDGVGIGFDLGATYKLLDNLTLSAALTDIGFISWKGAEAKANPDPFIFDGFHHFGAEDDPVTGESQLDQETDQLEEDLKKSCALSKQSGLKKHTKPDNNSQYRWGILNLVRQNIIRPTFFHKIWTANCMDRTYGFSQFPSCVMVQCNHQRLFLEYRTVNGCIAEFQS